MAGRPSSTGISPEQRFRRLYGAHHLQVYGYCRRRADAESAKDATAETFLVAWRRLDDVPADDGLPWLLGVARKVLANQRRSARRFLQLKGKLAGVAADPGPVPEAMVVRESTIQSVLDAMGRLREPDREVLRLAAWEELSHREIGDVFGCSAHAVDQRLHRAKQRLARELQQAAARRTAVTGHEAIEEGGTP